MGIDFWEYLLAGLYGLVIYVYFGRRKRMMLKLHPEYKYYVTGLYMKYIGGFAFCMIYFFYYKGGDTMGFFYSGVAMKQMLFIDPVEYIRQVILGDNSIRAYLSYANLAEPPYRYAFVDNRIFPIVRLSSILAIFTFNSYLISTLVLASLSFAGAWVCFRTFVSYFPQVTGRLAIAFLFMPSAVFWGAGIMKDTLTFSAVCGFVHAVDEIFFKKRNQLSKILLLVFCALVMIQVKPYIFMVILPASMLWILYFRVANIRSVVLRYMMVPLMSIGLIYLILLILQGMGDQFDKFALDDALENIQIVQGDMVNNTTYGDNKFDVGEFDGTWWGVVSKFPVATGAALFRPYLWEAKDAVNALSGLENLFILGLTIYVLFKAGIVFTLKCLTGIPLLLMSIVFSLLFAFAVGVTTANFGALVRFKIPMLPFYISSCFIVLYLAEEKRQAMIKRKPWRLSDYRMGSAFKYVRSGGRRAARGGRLNSRGKTG